MYRMYPKRQLLPLIMNLKYSLVFMCLLFNVVKNVQSAATGLPPSLKACRLNDPELGECIKKSAQNGIKEFTKGDEERGIPKLDPIELKKVNPLRGGTLNILLKNLKIRKIGDLKFTKFTIDTKKLTLQARLIGDVKVNGNYDMNGRLLILPIVGKGDITVDIKKVEIIFTLDYKLVKKNGKEYAKIVKTTLATPNLEFASIHLTNLFGGNKLLGDNTNLVLNENWRIVYDEIAESVFVEANKFIAKTLQKLFDVVTYDELLLPD